MNTSYIMLQSCLGLAAMLIFWYGFWKDYVIDKFRQDIFALRNDLFLATARGEAPLSFESQEYKKTVEILNVSIRCVQNFNIVRIILMSLFKAVFAPGRSFESLDSENPVVSSNVSDKTKEYLKDIQCRHGMLTMRYLATISPAFVLIMLALGICVFVMILPTALDKSVALIARALKAQLRAKWRHYGSLVGELTEISAGHEIIGAGGGLISVVS